MREETGLRGAREGLDSTREAYLSMVTVSLESETVLSSSRLNHKDSYLLGLDP